MSVPLQFAALPVVVSTVLAAVQLAAAAEPSRASSPARIAIQRDDDRGELKIVLDGKEALVYQYGKEVDLPHYYPVRSPSGKPLTIQQTEPYPHHRSFWFADTVQLAGQRKASFYNALYSCADRKDPKSPFRDRIRNVEIVPGENQGNQAEISMKLVWEIDQKTPVIDEARKMRIVALGGGEYLLDITFTVTASYGDVTFLSDTAHYAWPYVRICPEFSVQKGGAIANSEGGVNQAGTNGKPARWVDYSSTVDGATEGLAIFCPPDGDSPVSWLTRDYGTFGPRRADPQNGKPFTVPKGESLQRRVGILVHSGDVQGGRVAERYAEFVEGKL